MREMTRELAAAKRLSVIAALLAAVVLDGGNEPAAVDAYRVRDVPAAMVDFTVH